MVNSVCNSKRGFTLVELVTIMVIIGVLAAFVIPRMFSVTAFTSRGYFDQLIQATRYANKLAVTSGCATQIAISTNNFTLKQPNTMAACSNGGNWGTPAALPGTSGGPYQAPTNVTTIATSIVFLPNGAADGNYTVTVTNNSDGTTLSFKVYQDTGYVQRL